MIPSFIISKDTMQECKNFAEARLPNSSRLYKKRGEQVVEKIRADIYNGALAEWAVYHYLALQGIEVSKPDMAIYDKKQKSFAADLCNKDLNIHVKSQSAESAKKHGLSWTFQSSDPLVWQPTKKDYVVFCKVVGNLVELKAAVKAEKLYAEELYVEPRAFLYSATKTVVYYDEMEATNMLLWEL